MKRDRATGRPDPARVKAEAGLIAPRTFEKDDRTQAVDLLDFLSRDYAQLLRRLTRKFGSTDFAADALQDLYVRICTASLSSSIDKPRAYLYQWLSIWAITSSAREARHPARPQYDRESRRHGS